MAELVGVNPATLSKKATGTAAKMVSGCERVGMVRGLRVMVLMSGAPWKPPISMTQGVSNAVFQCGKVMLQELCLL